MRSKDTSDISPANQDFEKPLPESDDGPESHRGAFGEFAGEARAFIDRTFQEKLILVGVSLKSVGFEETMDSLNELDQLVRTTGALPMEKVISRRDAPHPATYVGRGKLEEIKEIAERYDADTVVFDDELTPAQYVNLEKTLGRTAIDRTAVILDIFAQNASSLEGKVQVELAQLRYRMARLGRFRHQFSQQAGGIGTRGPGETQLEADRRRIARRIKNLEFRLSGIIRHQQVQSRQREKSGLPKVALVGYTNAGKSTLMNALLTAAGSDSDSAMVLSQNRLFSTLDTTTRHISAVGHPFLLMDTVGFIRKLPHQLVKAFASTLSGVANADLLLHVADASVQEPEMHIAQVRKVLREIGAAGVQELLVFNKSDKAPKAAADLRQRHLDSLLISAHTKEGITELTEELQHFFSKGDELMSLFIPFERSDMIALVNKTGQIKSSEASEGGMSYEVAFKDRDAGHFAEFAVKVRS